MVEAKGFKTWKQADLAINVGDERTIAGIKLTVGSASESVVVESAAQQLVPTSNGEHSALLSTQDIERLSLESRQVTELLKILPGMTSVPNGASNGISGNFSEILMGATGSEIGNDLSPNGLHSGRRQHHRSGCEC